MGLREQLTECTNPVTGDWMEITDLSATSTDQDRKVNVGKFLIAANANTLVPSTTSLIPVTINMPASTSVVAQRWQYNGATRVQVNAAASGTQVALNVFDNGTGIGPSVIVEQNNNASTPAAGNLRLTNRGGTAYYIWPDASGNLRINAAALPTSANDTSGTVVGAQTSWAGAKEDIAPWDDNQAALDAILAARLFSYRMKGDEAKREYRGIVITEEDRGAWYSDNDADNQTPALNMRNIVGYLIGAIQAQQAQIDDLKARLGV